MSFKNFKTERILLSSIIVLFLFVFASVFTKKVMDVNVSSAEESSESSSSDGEETSQDNEGSQEEDENSEEDESSQEESQDDDTQDDEKSEPSVRPVPTTRTIQNANINSGELSEKSSIETSQQSVEVEETSEVSEKSEPSEETETAQEVSEKSIKYIEGYGEVVSKEGNVALVKQDEKLFFLVPVEVESQVTLNDQGNVVDTKKSFLNWFLSVFSL